MTKYREILRMDALGISGRSISSSLGCSRNTVSEVIGRALAKGVKWPIPIDVDDQRLEGLLFPEKARISGRRLPNMEYIHKEMSKQGVTLSLLWDEYCAICKANTEIQ